MFDNLFVLLGPVLSSGMLFTFLVGATAFVRIAGAR
jgi:hypothetical protein